MGRRGAEDQGRRGSGDGTEPDIYNVASVTLKIFLRYLALLVRSGPASPFFGPLRRRRSEIR